MSATGHHWWVNIGSSDGLVPSGKMRQVNWGNADPDLRRHVASFDHNGLKRLDVALL